MVILLSLFPHYCDDLLSCHPTPCVRSGCISPTLLVVSWRHSSDPVHPFTHTANTVVHIWVLLSSSQAHCGQGWGWKTHRERRSAQFLCFYVAWIWPHHTCCYLIWWLACLPQRSGALVQPSVPTWTVRLPTGVTWVGEKKGKRRKKQNKNENTHLSTTMV